MDTSDAARLGYEAWRARMLAGAAVALPGWNDLDAGERDAWIAAAAAVRRQHAQELAANLGSLWQAAQPVITSMAGALRGIFLTWAGFDWGQETDDRHI